MDQVKLRALITDSIIVFVSLVGVWIVTRSGIYENLGNYPSVFLTMPAMIWLSLLEDTPRVTLGLTLLAVGSFVFTIRVIDFMGSTSWLALQLYIVVIVFSSLIVHSMQLERTRLVKTLAMERDILEERVKERTLELEELATMDALTGALNRRSFFKTAEEEFKRARGEKPISVILLDIDKFKSVNDTYGHAMGDEVLKSMTLTMQNMIRGGADKLARMGGEEFAIILPETDLEGAVQTAERLRTAVEKLVFQGKEILQKDDLEEAFGITCSFGVAQSDLEQANINLDLSRADNALYEAKRGGRNRVVGYTG